MQVVAISGSARKDGNTARLLQHVFAPLEAAGVGCELIQLAGQRVHGCTACMKCAETKDGSCPGIRDFISETCIPAALIADALVIASPVYFGDVSTEAKAFIDRLGYAARQSDPPPLARKIGAAVVAQRRAGALHALDTINHLFMATEMIVPASSYWNLGIGRAIGEVEDDAEGMRTMERLGENISWLLEKLHV